MTGTIVAAYVPRPEGEAALARAVAEARLRGLRPVVVNASRGDALVDPAYASPAQAARVRARLADSGVEHEVRHLPAVANLTAGHNQRVTSCGGSGSRWAARTFP